MPIPYTSYNPNETLSQSQVSVLAEIKKIIEARILHNTNLLEFLLEKENKTEVDELIKNLFFTCDNSKTALYRVRKDFILRTKDDIESYITFLKQIKICRTVHALDSLYFQFFLQAGSLQHQDNIGGNFEDQYLSEKKISAKKKKELNDNAKKASEETDIYEAIYYKEFSGMLEPHISKRSLEFKLHHTFKYTVNCTLIGETPLGNWLFSNLFTKLASKLATKIKEAMTTGILGNLTAHGLSQIEDVVSQYNKITEKLSEKCKQTDNFELYEIARQRFDLVVDSVLQADKLLHPPLTITPALFSEQKMLVEDATDPTISVSPPLTLIDASNLNVDVAIEKTTCSTTLIEDAPGIVVHLTENASSKPQAPVSTCVSAFTPMEQKNDTSMALPLIGLAKINPALQFIAKLNHTESGILLDWAKKAPHMQVALTGLERIIKKLDGIIDTSSGGSHHRIIFKNSLAFIDAFEQSATTGTKKENTIKGTLVKQHGKKSSRFLPAYAIKTFMNTLQKIGVTETILRIYKSSCSAFPNSEDKMMLLTKAQMALAKNQTKMLLLLGIYRDKAGYGADLKKLDFTPPGRKPTENTQHLVRRLFSFI